MSEEILQIASRIRELREISGCSVSEMARDLGIDEKTYQSYETDGLNIPISALYHIAQKFHVDFNEILTGKEPRLTTYSIVRRGQGASIDRYPGYSFQSLAYPYVHKMMEPLIVTVQPEDHDPVLVTHPGQEFNYVLEGSIELLFDQKRFVLNTGDCVYFNPAHPHGQRACGSGPAKFLTVIAE